MEAYQPALDGPQPVRDADQSYAVEVGILSLSPTASMKPPKAKSQSRRPWTDEEIAAYESRHAIGTKARLAFALGLYTG